MKDTAIQTEFDMSYSELQLENADLKKKLEASKFWLRNIKDDNKKIQFYTGFPTYTSLFACYNYLGPAFNCLRYWGGSNMDSEQRLVKETDLCHLLKSFF